MVREVRYVEKVIAWRVDGKEHSLEVFPMQFCDRVRQVVSERLAVISNCSGKWTLNLI